MRDRVVVTLYVDRTVTLNTLLLCVSELSLTVNPFVMYVTELLSTVNTFVLTDLALIVNDGVVVYT